MITMFEMITEDDVQKSLNYIKHLQPIYHCYVIIQPTWHTIQQLFAHLSVTRGKNMTSCSAYYSRTESSIYFKAVSPSGNGLIFILK